MTTRAIVTLSYALVGCSGSDAECGQGTVNAAGKCVPAVTCGPGTKRIGDVCLLGDVDASTGLVCGTGTHVEGNVCVQDTPGLTCGTGTHEAQGKCIPDTNGLSCGPGTTELNGQCVPSEGGLSCGSGTHEDAGQCVPDNTAVACGAGTIEKNGACVPVASAGNGDVYQVFVGASSIPADGYTKIPVLAVGWDATGAKSTAAVVLSTSRPDAGSISPANATLGALGTTAFFTPCSSAQSPTCVGPFNVTLALASAPNVVVATSENANLVVPTGVGSDAPCLTGGNVLFFDGDAGDYIHPGTETITAGSWSAQYSQFHIALSVSGAGPASWWNLDFSTAQLNLPIATQVYLGAERWPFESAGKPGLSIDGDGKGCNTLTGKFEIETLAVSSGTIDQLTATFEQHCEGGGAALRGCIHYQK